MNGKARITTDNGLMKSFEVDGKLPRAVIVIEWCYFKLFRRGAGRFGEANSYLILRMAH